LGAQTAARPTSWPHSRQLPHAARTFRGARAGARTAPSSLSIPTPRVCRTRPEPHWPRSGTPDTRPQHVTRTDPWSSRCRSKVCATTRAEPVWQLPSGAVLRGALPALSTEERELTRREVRLGRARDIVSADASLFTSAWVREGRKVAAPSRTRTSMAARSSHSPTAASSPPQSSPPTALRPPEQADPPPRPPLPPP